MKKEILLLMIMIVLISGVSAIRINEVEMNPVGTDSKNEWIELYSEEEVNLEDYKLVNNDGDELNLEGNFSGYFIYIFSKQWLDNSDEKVFLYKESELIDETDTFDDSKNDDLTWQLCDVWEFRESTKEKENNCSKETDTNEESTTQTIEETTKSETSSSDEQSSSEKEVTYEPLAEETPSSIKLETINLNPKVIKTENNNEEINKSYAFYGFVAFSVFLGVLFIIRKNKYKNEFR